MAVLTEISMTTFADFVLKAGTPKATVVRQWKKRSSYHPSSDYYKALRESIVECHSSGAGVGVISAAVTGAGKARKANYDAMAKSYIKWLGRSKHVWFAHPKAMWQAHNIGVRVRPELGLEIGGARHLVKLYFKSDILNKNRADILLQLMVESFSKHTKAKGLVSILDVRQGKLFSSSANVTALSAQLSAEAAYWAALWPKI